MLLAASPVCSHFIEEERIGTDANKKLLLGGSALASTWNTKLVEAVATSIGEDCHKKGMAI